jgi:hypothetical protein
MARAVSHHPLTAEAWIQSQASASEICGKKGSNRPGFSLSTLAFPSVAFYQCAILIHSLIHLVLALYGMHQEEFAILEENAS